MSALFSSLLVPGMLALLALAPLIVLMYLLKLKRRPLRVPSTLLWRRSVQDLVANAPFQKLRNNLLLWLQLLILLLLVFALARPVMKLAGMNGETIIVLLDQSASMQTREDDGQTRFEKAKKLALQAVDAMNSGSDLLGALSKRDEMMIVGFSNATVPLQPMTRDKGALRAAIEAAKPADTATDLTDAGYILQERTTKKVEGALEPNPDARVILISDGRVGPSVSSLSDIVNLDFSAVGKTQDNVGFTAIDVRESFSGNFEYQLFATLFNSNEEAKTVYVELEVAGDVLDLKKVEIPPRASSAVVFTIGETVSGLATVKLTDHVDAFPADDLARAMVSPPADLKVLIVSRGNSFLQGVFEIDPRVSVSLVRPTEYVPSQNYDITVFDNCTAPEIPFGNFLFVNALPPADTGYSEAGDRVEKPVVIDWNRVHPITRYANFQRVLIQDAMKIAPPPAALPLIEATETDLLSMLETDTRRIVIIGFDLKASYWPVDVSFPIFFANLIDYWSRTGRGINRPAYATGETVPIVPPLDAKTAVVTTPTGAKINYPLEGQTTIYLTESRQAGVYTLAIDQGTPRTIPVNLASAMESDIKPVDELSIGGRKITASKEGIRTRQELWPWLALAALLVLMIEWIIYCRRTFM